jgi:hypothetical protein
MLSTISSQPIAGAYQDTKGRRITKLEWQEETKPTTNWQEILSKWWQGLQAQNAEFLMTQDNLILEANQKVELTWSADLTKPSTNWTE